MNEVQWVRAIFGPIQRAGVVYRRIDRSLLPRSHEMRPMPKRETEVNRDNPLNFLVNAFWTVPFLAACAWAQWLDEANQILEDMERTSAR
jgi:hypothetical protein